MITAFMRPVSFIATIVILLFVVSACGSSSRVRYDSPQEAYEKGVEAYEAEKYQKAIEYFQGVFDFGRTTQWAANAQLYLARAYRGNKELLLAANEYTRFTQIYRSDPRVVDAEYELALTYYDRSPAYDLDQTDTEKAIRQFRLFLNRYPTHQLAEEARSRILELREKLAHKQFEVALLYERRRLYESAALSFESVFDHYYDSSWADKALFGAIRTYYLFAVESIPSKQKERLEKAVLNYDRLIQIFPDSPVIKEAEITYLDIKKMLDGLPVSS